MAIVWIICSIIRWRSPFGIRSSADEIDFFSVKCKRRENKFVDIIVDDGENNILMPIAEQWEIGNRQPGLAVFAVG